MRDTDSRRYIDLFQLSPEGCLVTDKQGRVSEVNRAARELLWVENGNAQGHCLFSSAVGEDREVLLHVADDLILPGENREIEVMLKSGRGNVFHAAVNVTMMNTLSDVNGTCLRWSIRDITRRKKMEDELYEYRSHLEALVEQRTAMLQTVLDTIPVGLVVVKTEGREISYLSPSAAAILGCAEPITTLDISCCQLLWPNGTSLKSVEMPIYRSLNGEHVSDCELLIRRKDGSEASVIINSAPMLEASGRITGAVASITDITDRKHAEEGIKKSELLLQKVLEVLPIGVWILGRNGRIYSSNPAGQYIWGCSGSSYIEELRHFKGFRLDSGIPVAAEEWAAAKAINEGKTSLNEEVEIEGLDGKRRIILNSAIPLRRGRQGEITGAIIVDQDITASKRIESQIRQLTRQLLKKQERERQSIFYDLHDGIGQELSVVKIWVDTLTDPNHNPLADHGEKLDKISKKLQEIIMAVRDIAYTLKPATLDQLGVVKAIGEYCEDFTARNDVRVEFSATGMDEVKMDFDTSITLYRLVQECLDNVQKHAEANNVTVKLVASYPNIILDITDDGKGFDASSRPLHIPKGKCMGLAGMEERIALIEGKMRIRSLPMQGTVVRFEVPGKERFIGCGKKSFDY